MNRFRKYLTGICTLVMMGTSSSIFANFLVVTPEQVVTNTEGLFVSIGEIAIPVESLNIANDGYIVAVPLPQADICPNCGHDGYIPGRFCRWCNFPDDAKINPHVSTH